MSSTHPSHPQDREAVDDATLRQWIDSCDPYTPIDPTDRRYVPLSQAAEGSPLRGEDHVTRLIDAIELGGRASCQLFSGFSGTGKSTELRRLKGALEEKGYVVLLVDARDYHDLNHPLTIEDLMVLIAATFGEATAARLGKKVAAASYWQRFERFLEDIRVSGTSFSLPAVGDLEIGLKHERPFWIEIRDMINRAPNRLRTSVHDYVRECVAALEANDRSAQGVVFIVDSLEKLNAPPAQFNAVMESVLRILTDFPTFLRLPDCHVLYTVPPYVQLINPTLRENYRVSHVLPVVKVLEQGSDHQAHAPGIAVLTTLLDKRVPVERFFGGQQDLLERLIIYSGGHVRTLITFIQELVYRVRHGGLPCTEEDIEAVVQPFREQARRMVWRDSTPLLERIRREGTIEGIHKDEYETVARFMDSYLVLCYRNGDDWYEIHPLVREHVRKLAREIASEAAGDAS